MMITSPKQIRILIAAVALLVSTAAIAQDNAKKSSPDATTPSSQQPSVSKKSENKPNLSDVLQVSTADAARSAAHEEAKKHSQDQQKSKVSDGSSVDSVLEFSPAPPDADGAAKTEPIITTKHSRKNVHGEAYGSLDPAHRGNHQAGGAMGASTKSGKASVYVETDQTRSTTQSPH